MAFRLAKKEDIKEITKIYNYYVENSEYSFEYDKVSEPDMLKRMESTIETYPYVVYEEEGVILGFVYLSAHNPREAYGWNAVLTTYLNIEVTSKGIASKMYDKIFPILKMQNLKNIYGCITTINERSIKMHQKYGFKICGEFPNSGFKNGKWLSITWIEKQITELEIPPKAFIPFKDLDKNKVMDILNS